MKKVSIVILFFFLFTNQNFAQLVGINSTKKLLTNYNYISPNDTIYVYCEKDVNQHAKLATLNALPNVGVPPFTFDWQKYDTITHTYINFWNDIGLNSTKDSLKSGGYNVIATDSNGAVQCMRCWVFIDSLVVIVDSIAPRLDSIFLNAQVYSAGSFMYWDPPISSFLIDSNTTIKVCFDATHTYISDLGFFIVGPSSCGSPTIAVGNVIAFANGGNNCNSGDDAINLCFGTSYNNPFNGCVPAAPHNLSGNYASNNPWDTLYGCNVLSPGWAVQIYDCVASDVGTLTKASISFVNNSPCGQFSYTYNSGPINIPIVDFSCTPQGASIYTFNQANAIQAHTIANPFSYNWVANPVIPNLGLLNNQMEVIANPMPNQTTWFTLTVSDSISNCTSIDSAKYWYSTAVEMNNKEAISLNQNTPNPFNEKTVISYSIPTNTKAAQILVYDGKGNTVKTVTLTEKGKGQITLYANNFSSGLYTYRLVLDGKVVKTKKMICSK